jgi:hypothetical protein
MAELLDHYRIYISGYVTRICWKYPIRTDAFFLGDPLLCDDPNANCTDEDCK